MATQQILILGLLIVGMYFLVVRPQQQRQKQHRATVSALQPGKRVVTIGGLIGVVVELKENSVVLEVHDGGTVEFLRDAIGRILPDEEAEAEDAEADEELAGDESSDGAEDLALDAAADDAGSGE